MSQILLTGGTGTLGKEIAQQLITGNHNFKVLISRNHSEEPKGVTLISGDITKKETLTASPKDTDIIIHCASNSQNHQEVDVIGTKNLLDSAPVGLSHFVYISIVGVDKSSFPYYQAKYKAEQLVMQSGLPWTIIRATQFHSFVLLRFIKPFVPNGDEPLKIPQGLKFQSIDIKDVGSVIVKQSLGEPLNSIILLGGPEVLTLEQMTESYLKLQDKSNIIEPQPVEGSIHDLFRSGINLCPDNANGKITWKEYLRSAVMTDVLA